MGSSVALYEQVLLSGLSKSARASSGPDPTSFAVTFDDPEGHVFYEGFKFGRDHAVISRVSSTGYQAKWRDDDNFTFVFQRVGRYDVQIAGLDYGMSQGSLLAYRPGERQSRIRAGRGGLRNGVTLQVPVGLMNALTQSMETTADKVLLTDGTALSGEVGHVLSRLLPQLADDLMLRPSKTPAPRVVLAVRQLAEDVLCEMIGRIIEQRSWRRVFPAFHRVRQAEEIMHANSDEPLSMQEIAQVLGVSLRSLQLAFAEVYGGLSPRDVLNRIRLEKARARLLAADGNVQVTTVAMDSGLFHLGRFSQSYARAFGEKPSETLLRRRVS